MSASSPAAPSSGAPLPPTASARVPAGARRRRYPPVQVDRELSRTRVATNSRNVEEASERPHDFDQPLLARRRRIHRESGRHILLRRWPAPRPSSKRPPDNRSSDAASHASCSGLRMSLFSTNVPRRMRSVAVAIAAKRHHRRKPRPDVIAHQHDVEAELLRPAGGRHRVGFVFARQLEPEPNGRLNRSPGLPRRQAATTRATTATTSGTTRRPTSEKSARSSSAPVRSTRIERVYLRSANRARRDRPGR